MSNNDIKLSNGVCLPAVMLGTFQLNTEALLSNLVSSAFSVGFKGFDTAPSYKNEEILGSVLHSFATENKIDRKDYFLSDKIDVMQMYSTSGNIESIVETQLKKLQTSYLDLLLIHWPYERYLISTWHAMERLYNDGRVKAIGLCNVQRKHIDSVLTNAKHTGPMVVQNEISPLCINSDTVQFCLENKITVEAYSPLCRMHPDIAEDPKINFIAKAHKKSVGQIILRWHVQRGIIPVFMSKKAARIRENTDIFDFALTEDEMQFIESLDRDYHLFPQSYACPGY